MKLKLTYFLVIIMVLICSMSSIAASDLIDSPANYNDCKSEEGVLTFENENQCELTTNTINVEKELNENSNNISENSYSSIDCESTFNENENILAIDDNSNIHQYESSINNISDMLEDENSNRLSSNSISESSNDSFTMDKNT